MNGRRKTARTQEEHGIFGDEDVAEMRSEISELRALVTEMSERVHAQFTTISAHAEIAREQSDFARKEARADLERTRETLLDLIEQTRHDFLNQGPIHLPGLPPGPSSAAQHERFVTIDARLDAITAAVDRCFDRQRELADTMAALLDTVFADRRNEPVVGLSLA